MIAYYAATYFYQNDQEFRCTWDLVATKDHPTEEETICHLASMLEENCPDTWSLHEDEDEDEDEDSDLLPKRIDLYGLSPQEFARHLVLNIDDAEERFGATWMISTLWVEVSPSNEYFPCNL